MNRETTDKIIVYARNRKDTQGAFRKPMFIRYVTETDTRYLENIPEVHVSDRCVAVQ